MWSRFCNKCSSVIRLFQQSGKPLQLPWIPSQPLWRSLWCVGVVPAHWAEATQPNVPELSKETILLKLHGVLLHSWCHCYFMGDLVRLYYGRHWGLLTASLYLVTQETNPRTQLFTIPSDFCLYREQQFNCLRAMYLGYSCQGWCVRTQETGFWNKLKIKKHRQKMVNTEQGKVIRAGQKIIVEEKEKIRKC